MKGENDFAPQLWPRRRPRRWSGQVGVETHPAFAGHAYAWTRNAKGGICNF